MAAQAILFERFRCSHSKQMISGRMGVAQSILRMSKSNLRCPVAANPTADPNSLRYAFQTLSASAQQATLVVDAYGCLPKPDRRSCHRWPLGPDLQDEENLAEPVTAPISPVHLWDCRWDARAEGRRVGRGGRRLADAAHRRGRDVRPDDRRSTAARSSR